MWLLRQKKEAAGLLVIVGVSFLAGAYSAGYLFRSPPQPPRVVSKTKNVSPFTDAAVLATPAVVNIRSEGGSGERRGPLPRPLQPDPFFREFFKSLPARPKTSDPRISLGSGVIISRGGYILTNDHVVKEPARITVRLNTKEELNATVVGRDPKTDLAVIRVDSNRDLPAAILGNSDRLRVGEWVLAIGNPFGLDHTVTVGVISATGRSELGVVGYENFIQTDASINPGNSGGPLLNVRGEVVGINTAIVASAQGIGFAIPINLAKRIARDLIANGRVVRGWLGIGLHSLTADVARALKVVPDTGILVTHVAPNGPGAGSGLKPGDVITGVGEQKVRTPEEVRRLVAEAVVGSTLSLVIRREQETLTLSIPVVEKPE
ncbi:MAG: S1C family serine protease [Candidatus Methylomirabilales bacterium]